MVSDIQLPLHSSYSSYRPSVRLGSHTLLAGNKCYQRHEFHALQTPCPPLLAGVRAHLFFWPATWFTILLNDSHTIMLYRASLDLLQAKYIIYLSLFSCKDYSTSQWNSCFKSHHFTHDTSSLLLHLSSFPADDSNEGTMDLRPKIKMSPTVTGDPDMHARQMESFDHLIGTYVWQVDCCPLHSIKTLSWKPYSSDFYLLRCLHELHY